MGFMVVLLWMILLMSLMGTTADQFFVPPLTLISDSLHLSPVSLITYSRRRATNSS